MTLTNGGCDDNDGGIDLGKELLGQDNEEGTVAKFPEGQGADEGHPEQKEATSADANNLQNAIQTLTGVGNLDQR